MVQDPFGAPGTSFFIGVAVFIGVILFLYIRTFTFKIK